MRTPPLAAAPVAAFACLVLAASAAGQGLWSAASDGTYWLARSQQAAGSVTLYFRFPTDPPQQLRPLTTLAGRLTQAGIAASPQQLWLVFSNGSVSAVDVPTSDGTRSLPATPYVATPLPKHVEVVALAATESGLWALVRQDEEALLPMQEVGEAEKAVQSAETPATGQDKTPTAARKNQRKEPPRPQAATPQPAAGSQPDTRDQLLHLAQARWQPIPLPTNWPHGSPALLLSDGDQSFPILVATGPPHGLTIFTPQASGEQGPWSTMPLGNNGSGPWRALAVRRQIILAERRAETTHLAVRLWLARPSGLALLAELAFPDVPAGVPWSVSGLSDRIALATSYENQLRWTACDLTGRQLIAPQTLVVQRPPSLLDQPDLVLLTIGLVVAALLVVYVLARRAGGRGQQPRDVPLASLAARAVAAALDLVPCFAAVVAFFPSVMSTVGFDYWPGRSGTWSAMLPGAIVIVLFVGHTAATECVWGWSLGKRVLGLRVVDMSGRRPHAWQVLARNLLKALDLIVPPLLILLVISPLRQRLGDLVAQTLVATQNQPTPGDDPQPPTMGPDGNDTSGGGGGGGGGGEA